MANAILAEQRWESDGGATYSDSLHGARTPRLRESVTGLPHQRGAAVEADLLTGHEA
jgi:hypothetical protein